MDKLKFEKIFHISSFNSDFSGRASIQSLLQFFQEIAWEHAEKLHVGFSDLIKRNLIWVLIRQKIKILNRPSWQDNIRIITYARGREKLFWYRDFEIKDENKNQIAKATSLWMIIDLDTRKPFKGDDLIGFELGKGKGYWGDSLSKLPKINMGKIDLEKTVAYSDIDLNNHVNNVKYLEWILDSYHLDFLRTHEIDTVELNYISEAAVGEKIKVESKKNDLDHLHSITSSNNNNELFKSRILWLESI
jgi:acyl-ACP thioesterase